MYKRPQGKTKFLEMLPVLEELCVFTCAFLHGNTAHHVVLLSLATQGAVQNPPAWTSPRSSLKRQIWPSPRSAQPQANCRNIEV